MPTKMEREARKKWVAALGMEESASYLDVCLKAARDGHVILDVDLLDKGSAARCLSLARPRPGSRSPDAMKVGRESAQCIEAACLLEMTGAGI